MDRFDRHSDALNQSERKVLREIKDKLLGSKKENTKEYKLILNKITRNVIPRFERTRALKIIKLPSGEYLLTCALCRYWKKQGRLSRLGCRLPVTPLPKTVG